MSSFFRSRRLLMATLFIVCHMAAADEQPLLTLEAATQKVIQDNPDLAQILARAKAMAAIPSQEAACPIRKSVSMP